MSNLKNSPNSGFEPIAKWITKEYFQNGLQKCKKDKNLKVIDATFTPATAKGENYASVMIRARVKYLCSDESEPREEKYILKMPYEANKEAREFLARYDVSNKELDIYENVIPEIVKLLKEAGDNEKLFAEVAFVDHDHCAIIFEDLTVKSYVLADRVLGLDMDHTKMILRKLAKMHATSALINERSPGIFKKFDRGLINRNTKGILGFLEGNLVEFANVASQWGSEYEVYVEKLRKLKPMFMEYARKVFDVEENYFNVLTHGDTWTNNFMFTYDDQKNLVDGLLIDFQFSAWGSPAIDLHYFFHTSLREEIRLNREEELIHFYYTVLVETLKKVGFRGKIPSLHQFWIQMISKNFYAFTSAFLFQPFLINENTENADFDAIIKDDERSAAFKRVLYANPKAQEKLKRLLPIFDRKGLLDIQ